MLITIIYRLSFLFLFLSSLPAHSAVFNISSGDDTGLIAAINTANSTPEPDVINLARGTYTLRSSSAGGGFVGLPNITTDITMNGDDPATTIIERDSPAALFRILAVGETGNLRLNRLTVRGGVELGMGGGIFNGGSLAIHGSVIENNVSGGVGGGISNSGTLILSDSLVAKNGAFAAGGGIANFGTAMITRSSIIENDSAHDAGGIENGGTAIIVNSTITNNVVRIRGAGIVNAGSLKITNSTVAANTATFLSGGGIANIGTAELQNTILALNTSGVGPDCFGSITSLGNNVIGDTSGCDIVLVAGDLTGDPGLGAFIDSGAPGNGRFPLLPGSPAIDAGNDSACPPTDQLGTTRLGRCDIGAVEFYPLVNDLVALANVKTDFDPTPVPNGPAGTFRIIAEFTNASAQPIGYRFAEVVELAEGNLLLNADRGAGAVGARLTLGDNTSQPLLPGATETFEFVIGLQTQEPFTFFVNLLGDSQISNSSVTRLEKQ